MERWTAAARRERRGFTLAELLAVVAIIAVLVAVAIPTFSAATDRAKAGVCMANRRSLWGQLTYSKMLEGLDQDKANQMRDDFGVICPGGGTITVTVGDKITVACSIHGITDSNSGEQGNATVSQGMLKDYMDFVLDPQGAVSGGERFSNSKLREAFFAKNGGKWPTLTVNGVEYQVEPFIASAYNSDREIVENPEAYTWLFARKKTDSSTVTNSWYVPLIYNPKDGQWYERRKEDGKSQTSISVNFKDIKALEASLAETYDNGAPKWYVVEGKEDGWPAVQ